MRRFIFVFILLSPLFAACESTARAEQYAAGLSVAVSKPSGTSTLFNIPRFKSNLRLPAPRNFVYQEKFVSFGNASVRYLETGMNHQPPIVLLHGAQLRAESWKDLGTMRYLASRDFHVVSVDLPRHGKTGNPAVSKGDYLERFLESAAIRNPIVLAQSYAGSYVLPFLVKHRPMVKGVILLAPTNIRDYLDQLKRLSVPSLILWGGADEMISVQQASLLHHALAGSVLKVFPGAPHECYQTARSQFHTEIGRFVTGLRDIQNIAIQKTALNANSGRDV